MVPCRDLNKLDNAKGAKATDGALYMQCHKQLPQVTKRLRTQNMSFTAGTDAFILCAAALLNYETVAYFCNQDLERTNYATAIADYQVRIRRWAAHKAVTKGRFLPLCPMLVWIAA